MLLTIQTLFNDPDIVQATIDRVLQQGLDRIYWQQYLTFRRTTTRVFKDYLGTVTGVVAGSINSRFGEKPIRERRNIGSGYGEIAYLGDKYQMDVERLSELQDLIDKYNEAKTEDQVNAMNDIISYITDDYRQIILAPHKRMDIVVGSLLMTGSAVVKNKDDNKGGIDFRVGREECLIIRNLDNLPKKGLYGDHLLLSAAKGKAKEVAERVIPIRLSAREERMIPG